MGSRFGWVGRNGPLRFGLSGISGIGPHCLRVLGSGFELGLDLLGFSDLGYNNYNI